MIKKYFEFFTKKLKMSCGICSSKKTVLNFDNVHKPFTYSDLNIQSWLDLGYFPVEFDKSITDVRSEIDPFFCKTCVSDRKDEVLKILTSKYKIFINLNTFMNKYCTGNFGEMSSLRNQCVMSNRDYVHKGDTSIEFFINLFYNKKGVDSILLFCDDCMKRHCINSDIFKKYTMKIPDECFVKFE